MHTEPTGTDPSANYGEYEQNNFIDCLSLHIYGRAMYLGRSVPARLVAKAWQHGNWKIPCVHHGVGFGGNTGYVRSVGVVRHNGTELNVSTDSPQSHTVMVG